MLRPYVQSRVVVNCDVPLFLVFLFPPINDSDTMYVIGHNHKFIQFHANKMLWDCFPTRLNHFTPPVQPHLPADNLSKRADVILAANRHEIDAVLPVVVIR